jgi:hypothetical protein
MPLYLTVGYFVGGRWADRSSFHVLSHFGMGRISQRGDSLVSWPVLSAAAVAI